MIDAEVLRLRHLRQVALKTRALAKSLSLTNEDVHSPLHRSGLLAWRIARIVSGHLRAHPYESYQQDQGDLKSAWDEASAAMQGAPALGHCQPVTS